MTSRLPPRRPQAPQRRSAPLSNPNTVAELRLFPTVDPEGKVRVDSQLFERDDPGMREYRNKVHGWAHVVEELERRITDPVAYPRAHYPLKGLWEQLFDRYARLWQEGVLGPYQDRIIRLARMLAREDSS